jgi:hypothetical protein
MSRKKDSQAKSRLAVISTGSYTSTLEARLAKDDR